MPVIPLLLLFGYCLDGGAGNRVGDRTRNVIFRNRKSHKELRRHSDSIPKREREKKSKEISEMKKNKKKEKRHLSQSSASAS